MSQRVFVFDYQRWGPTQIWEIGKGHSRPAESSHLWQDREVRILGATDTKVEIGVFDPDAHDCVSMTLDYNDASELADDAFDRTFPDRRLKPMTDD